MAEKLAHAEEHLAWVPRFLLWEPRGHRDAFGALITPACSPEADVGLLFLDNQGYEPMCGHAIIGAATTLVETGMVPVREPEAIVTLDTPSGLIKAQVNVEAGRAVSVSFLNVPAFVYASDVALRVPEHGPLTIDVVFGGLFFVLIDAQQVGINLVPQNTPRLAALGMQILTMANWCMEVRHPELRHIDRIIDLRFYVELAERGSKGPDGGPAGADSRNVVILGDRMVDRSPCGTGTSAEAALRHARGRLETGQSFVSESVIGTRFTAEIVEETTVGSGKDCFRGVIPRITGSAYVTGFHRFVLDPDDPFPEGFRLGG